MSDPAITPMKIGMLIFENITALDLIGPMEPLSLVPAWTIDLVSESDNPVKAANGLVLSPDKTFKTAPQYDLFVVPGGPGVDVAMGNRALVEFVGLQCKAAEYVFGICTGSLLLGCAGVLQGKKASCHWQATEFLSDFGAKPTGARTTTDGKFFTSGGVTAGIDMALELIGNLVDANTAMRIQLLLEYDPKPPYSAGHPDIAPKAIVDGLTEMSRDRYMSRKAIVRKSASSLGRHS